MPLTPPQEQFRIAAKKRLIEEHLTITKLAALLGFARNTVSMAINHTVLPTVRQKVAEHLDIHFDK
jgi:predicted transcriptional regulator